MSAIRYLLLLLISQGLVAEESEIIKITDELLNKVSAIEIIEVDEKMRKRVAEVVEVTKTATYQSNVNEYKESITSSAGIISDMKQPKDQSLGHLVLFISKSIPLETLRNYARDLSKIGQSSMVMRGFVDSGTYMKPTLRFIHDILRIDSSCEGPSCALYPVTVDIDPLRFDRYEVKQVPALVHVPNHHYLEQYCDLDLLQLKRQETLVVGDATIAHMLEVLETQTNRDELSILKTLVIDGGNYGQYPN